jgi:MFS family permease
MGWAFYVLILLSFGSLLSYYDRYLMAILVQGIKAELRITDGQVGLLTGLGFAAVYALLGIPIARYSDGGRRVGVLAVSLAIWSLMSAACGFASNFSTMLLARLGVAVGEAGGVPTTHALVSEYFPQRWRGTALSAIVVVSGVGYVAASFVGGWLADRFGWRAAFWIGAAPGPLLAVLLMTTVREPSPPVAAPAQGWMSALRILLSRRAFVLLCIGFAICSIPLYASLAWAPAFLMRTYLITAGRVGATYGVFTGLSTIAALLIGGVLSDVLSRRDSRWGLWLMAIAYALALPFNVAFLFTKDLPSAVVFSIPMTMTAMIGGSTMYAQVQSLAGPKLRATAAAVFLLIVNLVGAGLGPSLVGVLSDLFKASAGSQSLQFALVVISPAYLVGALILWLGSVTMAADIREADA